MRFLSFLFLATAVGSATAVLPPSVLSRPTKNNNEKRRLTPRLLSIRGGAGPLDTAIVTKVAVGLGVGQGLLNLLCPEKTLEGYGWSTKKENLVAVQGAGFASLANVVMNYQMLQTGDVSKALSSALMMYVLSALASLINEDFKALGAKTQGSYVWIALNGAAVYGLSTGADWAMNKTIPAIAAMAFLAGSISLWDPVKGLALYGRDSKAPLSTETGLLIDSLGAIHAGSAAMMYAYSTGVETTKVIGYGFIPFVISLVKNVFVTKNYQKLNMDTTPFKVWIAMALVIIGTLSF